MVQFIQFPFSIFTWFSQTSFTKDLLDNGVKINNEPGRKHNKIHVCRLGHTIKIECIYRTMINLYDTLCTNSKVPVNYLPLFNLNQTAPVQYLQFMTHTSLSYNWLYLVLE